MREYSLGTLIAITQTLTAAQMTTLAAAGTEVHIKAGAALYRQGEPAADVWLLRSGVVKSVLGGPNGDDVVLRLHLPGSLLGLTALGSVAERDADAIATETARAMRIPVKQFEMAMARDADLARQVVGLLVDRMRDFHHRLAAMSEMPVRARLVHALLSLSRPDPAEDPAQRRPVRLTQAELAALTGARRPTISTALGTLETVGAIRRIGRAIHVIDPDRLMSS